MALSLQGQYFYSMSDPGKLNQFLAFILILTSAVLLLQGCANIVAPTGGIKDESPPKLLYTYPRNGETQFKGQKIILEFDEDIALNNLNQELIISPNLNLKYKHELKKKTLTVNFLKPLPENTTIGLHFRESIKDHNEGNTLADPSLAFSTGPNLDSIKVKGIVTNILTNQTVENCLVGLFLKTDTFALNKSKPDYFTKTSKTGTYQITNIRSDTFYLLAFNDANGNLQYDNKEERLAFIPEPIELINDTLLDLVFSPYDDKAPKVISVNSKWKAAEISFDEGIDSLQVSYPKNIKEVPVFKYDPKEAKLVIYRSSIAVDSIPCRFICTDSTANVLDTTLVIKFGLNEKDSLSNWGKSKLEVLPARMNQLKRGNVIEFSATHPIMKINTNGLQFLLDSIQQITGDSVKIKTGNGQAYINTDLFKFDTILNVDIDSQAIQLVTGKFVKKEKFNYTPVTTSTNENASSISGTLKPEWSKVIVELLNESGTKLKENIASERFRFPNLEPGTFQIRIVIDENQNSKWDKGNFKQGRLPEKLVFWKENILIKAGWDVEDINF